MADEVNTFMVEDAHIIYRNFEGKEGPFNTKGNRNFAVMLDPTIALQMIDDGWNVKYTNPREEGDEPMPFIPVTVNFKNRPPRIVMMTSNARTNLTEDTVETLDWANIKTADLICRAYNWEVGGKSGVKAYLQSLFVTIDEDELERKYAINTTGE